MLILEIWELVKEENNLHNKKKQYRINMTKNNTSLMLIIIQT